MKRILMFGLTTLFLFAGSNAYADPLNISGHANVWVPLTHSTATKELKTSVASEVDFEKKNEKATVRVDIDLPGATIEQAKVVLGLPSGMSLTTGKFNSPVGFELQDAPDKWQYSNGQLFDLVADNLEGVMWSWAGGSAGVDLFIANDWVGQATGATGHDNSVGGHLGLGFAKGRVDLGYITTERTKTGPAPTGNGNVMDLVLTASPMANTTAVFEYLTDDNNDGWGLTANHVHGKHGITGRYDSVETKSGSTTTEKTSLTVALSCKMTEGVTTNLEWKTTEPGGSAASVDHIVLQWVAPF